MLDDVLESALTSTPHTTPNKTFRRLVLDYVQRTTAGSICTQMHSRERYAPLLLNIPPTPGFRTTGRMPRLIDTMSWGSLRREPFLRYDDSLHISGRLWVLLLTPQLRPRFRLKMSGSGGGAEAEGGCVAGNALPRLMVGEILNQGGQQHPNTLNAVDN